MADNIIAIEIEIDGKKGFAKLDRDALKAGGEVGENLSKGVSEGFSKSLSGLKTQLLSLAAALGGGLFAKESIQASREQAEAIHNLSIALSNAGRFSEAAVAQFGALADRIQNTTKFSDDFTIALAKTATNFARTNEEAIKLTEAAIQLSSATGVDATTAVERLGLSLNGVSKGLNVLIPGFQKMSQDALKSGEAIDVVLSKFGGTAEAQVNSFGGAIAQASNKFNEMQESFGDIITQSPEVIAIIKVIGDSFLKSAESFKQFADSGGLREIILGVLNFALIITDTVIPVIETLKNAFRLFVNFAAGAIQEFLIIPLLALADTVTTVGNALGLTSDKTAESFALMKESAVLALDEINAKTLEAAADTGEFPLTEKIRTFISELQTAAITAPALVDSTKNKVNAGVTSMGDEFVKRAQQINRAFSGILAGGIASGVQKITQALISGQASFGNFTKIVIGLIGDMAIQLGTVLIGAGIGIEALKALGGTAAIAAGIGLVAIGTVLKALSGDGATGAPDAGGGAGFAGGGLGGGGLTTEPSEITEEGEPQKPLTQVAVNIEGNVLDRRETGLEIVNVLNEFFDTNNGVIART